MLCIAFIAHDSLSEECIGIARQRKESLGSIQTRGLCAFHMSNFRHNELAKKAPDKSVSFALVHIPIDNASKWA